MKYASRRIDSRLMEWKNSASRKPLLLRGARQVGKSSSYGVGRIRSLFMYPFSFDEYLRATGMTAMAEAIKNSSPAKPLSEALHHQCLTHLVRHIVLGGLPEVVSTFSAGGSLQDCQQVLDDLMLTYNDDLQNTGRKCRRHVYGKFFFRSWNSPAASSSIRGLPKQPSTSA